MKQLPIVFLMLFVLLYAAHAEGVYYYEANSQQEICYHATPLCIDAGGSNDVISEADAKAKGLLPCPICVQEAADPQGVRAVARGGTYHRSISLTKQWPEQVVFKDIPVRAIHKKRMLLDSVCLARRLSYETVSFFQT